MISLNNQNSIVTFRMIEIINFFRQIFIYLCGNTVRKSICKSLEYSQSYYDLAEYKKELDFMVPTGLISPSKRYSGILYEMMCKNKPKAESFLQNFVEKILNLKIL